ncbi:MAG: GNAT family N-acetyltransferase [Pleurocapsa sp. SU_196_0]|nr:GNAT family N-acetyltransferase [Pleurocapsa sp. SU_196_0]
MRQEDFEQLLVISSDPAVTRTNDYLPAEAGTLSLWLEETIASEARSPRTSHHSAIRLKNSDEIIGWIGLQLTNAPQQGRIDFGYALAPKFWNRGYMTEAVHAMLTYSFDTLAARIVTAFHLIDNAASGRVMLKAGMRLYDELMADRTDTEIHYMVTAEEWAANTKR